MDPLYVVSQNSPANPYPERTRSAMDGLHITLPRKTAEQEDAGGVGHVQPVAQDPPHALLGLEEPDTQSRAQ